MDNWATIETHSQMFKYLEEELGHRVIFEMADSKINFEQHDQYQFDNVILMAPSVKGTLPPNTPTVTLKL